MPKRFKPIPKITRHEVAPQIRQAIGDGNTAKAVNLFLQTGDNKSAALFEKFSEVQHRYEDKRIGIEEWARVLAQICRSILGTEYMRQTEIRSPELKAQILQLLHKQKTEQALALCVGLGDQYLLLQAQLNVAKSQSDTDLLASEYFEATKSRINYALQELMGQTTEPVRGVGWLQKILIWFK